MTIDPKECHDRIHDRDYDERIGYLRQLLIDTLSGREEGYSDGTRLIAGQSPVNVLTN